jgi:hypothetical protein
LPLPESKREVKIKDTQYSFQKISDLLDRKSTIETALTANPETTQPKKYEDMTREELNASMRKRRKEQQQKQHRIRKYQFFTFAGLGLFYLVIYRQFLHPKSIINSVLYNNAVKYVESNQTVASTIGTSF